MNKKQKENKIGVVRYLINYFLYCLLGILLGLLHTILFEIFEKISLGLDSAMINVLIYTIFIGSTYLLIDVRNVK